MAGPAETARLLVARFGSGWVVTVTTGMAMRTVNRLDRCVRRLRTVITEKGVAFELGVSGIMARFRPVLKHLQSLPGTDPGFNAGLFSEITEKEWMDHLAKAERCTAPELGIDDRHGCRIAVWEAVDAALARQR